MKTVLDTLQSIEVAHGMLTPILVVDHARDEESPLHTHFEWNNEKASDNWRLWQARQLIKSVTVLLEGKETQAFRNVRVSVDDHESNRYMSTVKIMSDKQLREQVIRDALSRIEYWQRQFEDIEELQKVVDQEEMKRLAKNFKK